MTPQDLAVAGRYWSRELGCAPEDLDRPGVRATTHGLDYAGAYVFRRGPACVIAVPGSWRRRVADALSSVDPAATFDPAWLQRLFAGGSAPRVLVGPAWLGYPSAEIPERRLDRRVRRLVPGDREALLALQRACDAREWEHGGLAWGSDPLFGVLEKGELVAAGMIENWRGVIGHLCLLTHPEARGRGHAAELAAAMAAHSRRMGLLPQYRTLEANTPSRSVAQRCGFEEYARTYAVRL